MKLIYILLSIFLIGLIVVFGIFVFNSSDDITTDDSNEENYIESMEVNEEFISDMVERPYDSCVVMYSEKSGICGEIKRITLLSLQKPIYFFNSDSKISLEDLYETPIYSMSLDFLLFNDEDSYWNFVNTTFIERSSIFLGDATIISTASKSQAKDIFDLLKEEQDSSLLGADNRIIRQIYRDNIGLYFIIDNYIYLVIVDSDTEDKALDVIAFLLS